MRKIYNEKISNYFQFKSQGDSLFKKWKHIRAILCNYRKDTFYLTIYMGTQPIELLMDLDFFYYLS